MEIINIDAYLDGGTIAIITTNQTYCIDSRIKTKTKGCIFLGYPKDDNSNLVPNQDEIKIEMKKAIEKYNSSDFFIFDFRQTLYKLVN